MRDLFRHSRRLLLIGLLLIGLLLGYSASLRRQEGTTLFERGVLAVTAPMLKVIDAVADRVSGVWSKYLWLVQVKQENQTLREENRQLRVRLQVHREYQLENERLRRLLSFSKTQNRPVMPAQVIGEDLTAWAHTVVIDKGLQEGLREGLPVVVAEGLVGQVIKCGPHEARVLLVTDASSAVGVLTQRTRTRGVCRGRGDHLTLEFALREDDVEVGDQVLTSGMGGIYPKGLVVGQVSRVDRDDFGLFQHVEVAPAPDFSRLEEVLVLLEKNP